MNVAQFWIDENLGLSLSYFICLQNVFEHLKADIR